MKVKEIGEILEAVNTVILGKQETVGVMLAVIISGGHILLEDVPGTGKTTLCKAMAKVLGCTFQRIQFTPDLMPSDIIGITVYDQSGGEFVFKPGPIMSQFVLADEINRTSPKTQAALLEAMAENQVTVDGATYPLPSPFIVAATQNPIEYEGTYPLPEAQLDRFMARLAIGYPAAEDEERIYQLGSREPLTAATEELIDPDVLLQWREEADRVFVSGPLEHYMVRLARATREDDDLLLGVSVRGGRHLYRAVRGYALVQGRDFVLPDDIKTMVEPVFAHRLILRPEARLKGKNASAVLAEILARIPVPVSAHAGN